MRKGLKIAGSTVFTAALSSCLFYCMVAGRNLALWYDVVMAALLSVIISVTLCCRVSLYPPSSEAFEELSEK